MAWTEEQYEAANKGRLSLRLPNVVLKRLNAICDRTNVLAQDLVIDMIQERSAQLGLSKIDPELLKPKRATKRKVKK